MSQLEGELGCCMTRGATVNLHSPGYHQAWCLSWKENSVAVWQEVLPSTSTHQGIIRPDVSVGRRTQLRYDRRCYRQPPLTRVSPGLMSQLEELSCGMTGGATVNLLSPGYHQAWCLSWKDNSVAVWQEVLPPTSSHQGITRPDVLVGRRTQLLYDKRCYRQPPLTRVSPGLMSQLEGELGCCMTGGAAINLHSPGYHQAWCLSWKQNSVAVWQEVLPSTSSHQGITRPNVSAGSRTQLLYDKRCYRQPPLTRVSPGLMSQLEGELSCCMTGGTAINLHSPGYHQAWCLSWKEN